MNDEDNIRKTQTLNHALRVATIRGSLEDVKSTLSKGVTVNQPLKGGWTALMYACSLGHPSIVDYLLKHGANPNFHKELFTPLMAVCASTLKNEDRLVHCTELLLQHLADVNMSERHHMTALMFAAREGHSRIVERLLAGSCHVDAQDSQGWTALFWATNQRKVNSIKVLLQKGANVDVKDIRGQTVIDLAANKKYDEILKILKNKQIRETEIQEEKEVHVLTDSKTMNKFEKTSDEIQQEFSLPIFNNNNNNINNNSRGTDSFTKLIKRLECENHKDMHKSYKIISKISKSVNRCLQNTTLFSHKRSAIQSQSVEKSWKNLPYSAAEAREVLEQTVRCLECLYTNISYIRLHTQMSVGPVLLEDKHARVSQLTALSDKALHCSTLLRDELYFLNRYTKQLDGSDALIPADFVKERNNDPVTSIFSSAVVAAVALLILFNTRTITLSVFSR